FGTFSVRLISSMLATSRGLTTNPFALRCFTHFVQQPHDGSLYTVTTDGGSACASRRETTSAAAPRREERSQSRRETMGTEGRSQPKTTARASIARLSKPLILRPSAPVLAAGAVVRVVNSPFHLVPAGVGFPASLVPSASEIRFHLVVPGPAAVGERRLAAIPIRRRIELVAAIARRIRLLLIVLAPIRVFG